MSRARTAWLTALVLVAALAAVTFLTPSQRSAAGPRAAERCVGTSVADFVCHRRRYEALVRDKGTRAALEQLEADYDRDQVVRVACHALSHAIADAAASRNAEARPLGDLGELCGSGYYAGRVEAFVAGAAAERALRDPDTVCASLRRRAPRSNEHHNCVHALGHGLMREARGDLLTALRLCDRLTDPWERQRCHSGAFMENITGSATRGATRRPKRDRLLYPCTAVPSRYVSACYRQQPSYMLVASGGDFARVFRLCARPADPRSRRACYQGLGVDMAAQSIADHITDAGAAAGAAVVCQAGGDLEARSNCVVGAARQFVDHYRDERAETVFCNLLDGAMRPACRRTGRSYYATLAQAPQVTPPWTGATRSMRCALPL